MQPVPRKKSHAHKRGRLWILLTLVLLLAGATVMYVLLKRETPLPKVEAAITYGELYAYEESDVTRLALTLRSGESYALTQKTAGVLTLEGDDGFTVSASQTKSLLAAASVVSYDDILTEDKAEIAQELADFGLDTPKVVAEITYADGKHVTLRIGDQSPVDDETWYFMEIDGDNRLFALDKDTAEALNVTQSLLHPVTQPTIHQSRLDQITFINADGTTRAQWKLDGDIAASDAASAWYMTQPHAYPADEETMTNFRQNIGNIRLGAYVGAATEENLTQYGFHTPAFTILLHMAAGTTASTDATGGYMTLDWPENTFTLTVGGAKNDSVDYVLVDGSIYVTSHYSLAIFTDMNPLTTLSRYPLMVTLSDLKTLTVDTDGETVTYEVWQEEQVANNNALVTDASGNVAYDHFCTRNGEQMDYGVFAATWGQLAGVSVTGRLPADFTVTEPVHTSYTFTTRTGRVHTLQLARFDALHDAVIIDGTALFYLISGGFSFQPI